MLEHLEQSIKLIRYFMMPPQKKSFKIKKIKNKGILEEIFHELYIHFVDFFSHHQLRIKSDHIVLSEFCKIVDQMSI